MFKRWRLHLLQIVLFVPGFMAYLLWYDPAGKVKASDAMILAVAQGVVLAYIVTVLPTEIRESIRRRREKAGAKRIADASATSPVAQHRVVERANDRGLLLGRREKQSR